MTERVLSGVGVGGGLFVAFVGVSHLWPLVSPAPGYNSLLHVITAWAMVPLGLMLAIRDADHAGMMNASSVLGTRFDAALQLVYGQTHFIIFLLWAGFAALSFGGLYGMLGFLLCFARAGTLVDVVRQGVDKGLLIVKDELEKRNINVPGFTDAPAAAEKVE